MPDTTILVADDEPLIRTFVARALRSEGYSVLEAGNGLDALAIADQHAGPIDLLLTDVRMPVLDGCQLGRLLKRKRPGTRVLYMSGYTGVDLGPDAALLRKPFTWFDLMRCVKEMLEDERRKEASA